MNEQQRSLFDQPDLPWEEDDQEAYMVARVVFSEGLDGIFDYRIPDDLRAKIRPGGRVAVPLGKSNRRVEAMCIAVTSSTELEPGSAVRRRLKPLFSMIDESPVVMHSLLRLAEWMSNYYLAPLGRVLEAMVPAGVRSGAGVRSLQFVQATQAAARSPKLSTKQTAVMQYLHGHHEPVLRSCLLSSVGCTVAPLKSLEKKGLIKLFTEKRLMPPSDPAKEESKSDDGQSLDSTGGTESATRHALTDSQADAVGSIQRSLDKGQHEDYVLHGVTGSGKTEVYIQAIEHVLTMRRQAIVLVPEISLTPQTRRRFRERFDRVAVLHSHLSDGERNWHWQQISEGKVDVIVGARSAVFAPTPNLGIIILDEEHDNSFKQDSIPRYHARDVARRRASDLGIPLVLGSATPALETWQAANSGNAKLLSMPNRVLSRPLPSVITIDMRERLAARGGAGPISGRLDEAIRQALRRRQQTILLLNRRGFSTHIQCPACGNVVECPNCELPLTYHVAGERAVCHYCEHQRPAPRRCPDCRFEGIRFGGLGTQKLEEEVRRRYPKAAVVRMDSDTMRKHGSHEAALDRFRRGEVEILVGTQMIAKGLDFPDVTVVGVINADTGLHMPDFRAAERSFQLVTQVAGRTGRGVKGGTVYLQTYDPEHPAIRAAERHDYLRFASGELPNRERFGYPPFGGMIRIIVRGPVDKLVEQSADEIASRFDDLVDAEQCRLLGPAPAPIAKLRGNYRYHMILQSPDLEPIRCRLRTAQRDLKLPQDVLWQADVDPWEMM